MAERPLRADAQRNRDKVLQAAREVFAESGFGVPLDEVAGRAGVGPGTIYRHFPNKEALFEAVVTARVADLVADARSRIGAADPGAAFFGFLERVSQESESKRDLSDAIALPVAMLADLHAALDTLLRAGQAAGAVRPDITAGELLRLIKGVMAAINEADRPSPDLRARMLAIITDGLRTAPRTA